MKNKTRIIEFFGLPKTGKTTSVNALKKYLLSKGIKTEVVIERASRCPIKNKLHPLFNYWTTFSLFKEFIEAIDKGTDVLIADRGLIDSFVWINCLATTKETKKYLSEYENIFVNNVLRNDIIKGYYFNARIETILNREFERQVNPNYGIIMNPKILQTYEKTYSKLSDRLNSEFSISEIDTNNLSIKEVVNIIATEIDSLL